MLLLFQGVFGGGKFEQLEDLIKVVSATIYLGSVQHAAVNFSQYDEYAFPPAYPAKVIGGLPTNKVKVYWLVCWLVPNVF